MRLSDDDVETFIVDHGPSTVDVEVMVLDGVVSVERQMLLGVDFEVALLDGRGLWIVWELMAASEMGWIVVETGGFFHVECPVALDLVFEAVDRDVCEGGAQAEESKEDGEI